ncbi:hypothetical protein [Haloplanus rubicundus]|uniref:Uncharacterized protein n=1 Tax=Haloplanus rubicundus TaxID=1547898 RepID=A0A345EAZ3_9EURY|nr:hypothetical protein [Haloplanus rubicundus]AXG09365.1 hypothetical protein DU484_05480 [Haloplanus rubicundus]
MVPNTPADDASPTRRAFLRRGAGAVAAGFVAATAGCTSALPPLGSAQRFGRIDVPDADPPRYRRWLPAPSAVDGVDAEGYAYLFRRPGALDYPAPVRFTTPRKRLLSHLDHFGIGYANYDRLLHTPFGTVLAGEFDAEAVGETLTDSGYAATGSDGDYDRFTRDDVPRRAAVGDGVVVWSSERVHDHPRIDALLDARTGRRTRYHDADAGVARLTDTVGESRMVEYVPPSDERYWQKCEGFRFDGDTAYHVMTFLYPEGRTPPESELRDRAVDGTVLTREVEHSDFRIDGRLVIVEGRIPPGEGIDPVDITPPYPPQITWGYASDTDASAVTVRHEAGDSVPTSALGYTFDADVPDGWLVLAEQRPLPTDGETLAAGDAVTLSLPATPTVEAIPHGDIDHEAANPYAAADPRPVARLELLYGPGETRRPVFAVPLEGSS